MFLIIIIKLHVVFTCARGGNFFSPYSTIFSLPIHCKSDGDGVLSYMYLYTPLFS